MLVAGNPPPKVVHPLLRERAVMYVADSGLPRTKLREDVIIPSSGYCISPLDMTSMLNGMLKFDHSYRTISFKEYFAMLDWVDALYGAVVDVPMWTEQQAIEAMDESKAAGYPYSHIFGPFKGMTIKNLSFDDLLQHFVAYAQIFVATLKDEERVEGKDARLFTPANVCMVAVGNFLFGAQNEAIMNWHPKGAIQIGLPTPGSGAYHLWRELRGEGLKGQSDGARNDANFSPVLAMCIRDFRKRHLPERFHKLVDLYYDMAYHMLVSYRGAVVYQIGLPTGHTNTATDNSLCYLMLSCLHCYMSGLSLSQFVQIVLYIMGDDMVWSDPHHVMIPSVMQDVWNRVGMYLESPSDSEQYEDLTFCGMHPVKRRVFGHDYWLYSYNVPRLIASLNLVKKSMTPSERLHKMVSIASLLYAEEEVYEQVKRVIYSYVNRYRDAMSTDDVTMLSMLNDLPQLRLHIGVEPLLYL